MAGSNAIVDINDTCSGKSGSTPKGSCAGAPDVGSSISGLVMETALSSQPTSSVNGWLGVGVFADSRAWIGSQEQSCICWLQPYPTIGTMA